MKKIILTGLAAFAMNTFMAQTNTANGGQLPTKQNNEIKVPSQIIDKFNTEYPNVDVTWGRDGENYTAKYKDQSTQGGRLLTYNKNGSLLYTDIEMNGTGYPTGIDDYYHRNYPDEKYTIWSSDDGKGDMSYYSKRKDGKRLWFDKNGKYSSSRPGSDTQNTRISKENKNNSKGTK